MTNESGKDRKGGSTAGAPAPFHERFYIQLDIGEARKRFLKRVHNRIFDVFFSTEVSEDTRSRFVLWQVANELGEEFDWDKEFDNYVKGDFHRCLQVLEISYNSLKGK